MSFRKTISIIIIFFLYGCETRVKEYDIQKLNFTKDSFVKDSLILKKLIINNETISGWEEDKKITVMIEATGLLYTQNDLNNRIYKFEHRKFYIFDTINLAENKGIVILRVEEDDDRTFNNKVLYLSLFDKKQKYLKTYLIAMDVEKGDGLIGGGSHIKSEITNKGTLITYCLHYGFLDCGNPPYIMDSIISKYNLKNGKTISIDTVKSIKPQKMI